MAKTLSWLHLSDFHCSKYNSSHWHTLRGKFYENLKKFQDEKGFAPWDVVFFTGDLVWGGEAEEFYILDCELIKLRDKLNEICGKEPILLCVPGNHDLKRPDDKVRKSARFKTFKTWNTDPDVSDSFWGSDDDNYKGLVNDAFANYNAWFEKCDFIPKDGLIKGSIPGDFSYETEINGIKLGVVGLNSAFLHTGDDVGPRDLALHRNQIQQLCNGDASAYLH